MLKNAYFAIPIIAQALVNVSIEDRRKVMEYQIKNAQYTLTEQEIKTLIQSLDKFRNRLILKLLANGLRRAEVCELEIMAVDFKRLRLRIVGKGNKVRIVYVSQEIINDIKYWIDKRKKGYVFPGKMVKGKPFDLHLINDMVVKAGKLAGIEHPNPDRPRLTPHLLRHSFARIAKDKGMSLEALQAHLGLASFITVMDTYGNMSIEQVGQEVAKVAVV